jgi:NAD(P)-dependent dehydrogenase (short-subunit alcohol dehydrogenase family)
MPSPAMRLERFFDLSGRRVLITGAAQGLGAAMATAFAAQGASLVLADWKVEALREAARALGPSVECHRYDQADQQSIETLAVAAGAVDVLVNNAGIMARASLLETGAELLRDIVAVDLVGVVSLTTLVARAMVECGGGAVVNIGSQMAFCGAEGRGAYAAAKAGVSQFTRTAAVEWGPRGIRVNCIAPGRMLTPMTREMLADPAEHARGLQRIPLRRYGDPADVAHVAVFLASDAAAYVTGQTVVVDGGWVIG